MTIRQLMELLWQFADIGAGDMDVRIEMSMPSLRDPEGEVLFVGDVGKIRRDGDGIILSQVP